MKSLFKASLLLAGLLFACAPTTPSQVEPEAYDNAEEAAEAAEALAQATVKPPPPVLASFVPRVINNGPRNRMRIAITFDACSSPKQSQYDDRITKTLEATNTPATIFVGGAWARNEPESVRELAQNPLFELGNHTYTHPHMTRLKDDRRVLDQFLMTQREVYDLTGKLPKYFRPPFGEIDGRVSYWAAQAGLTTINYDLASGDPDKHATKEKLVEWVMRKARPGGIIVMHINHKKFHTAEALPDIIKGLRAKGYELVTVDTLLHDTSPPACVDPNPDATNPLKLVASRRPSP